MLMKTRCLFCSLNEELAVGLLFATWCLPCVSERCPDGWGSWGAGWVGSGVAEPCSFRRGENGGKRKKNHGSLLMGVTTVFIQLNLLSVLVLK